MAAFHESMHLASHYRVVMLLTLSVSMVSSASILISLSSSPALVIVFWRTLLASVIMFSLGFIRNDHHGIRQLVATKGTWKWLIIIGVVLSLHFSTWFMSLLPPYRTTVAASVALVNTSPIFTALLSTFILGESLTERSWSGVAIAVGGSLLLTLNDLITSGLGALIGDLLALSGGVFLAVYLIGGRRIAVRLPLTMYTGAVYLTASLTTLLLCLLQGSNVVEPVSNPYEVVIFVALAIFPTVLGHSVNNYVLTLVPAYVVSSAVLGEPIGATLLAVVFLGQVPTPSTLVGFAVILVGIGLVLAGTRGFSTPDGSSLDDTDGPQSDDLCGDTDGV